MTNVNTFILASFFGSSKPFVAKDNKTYRTALFLIQGCDQPIELFIEPTVQVPAVNTTVYLKQYEKKDKTTGYEPML